jgi:ATP-dependent helicase HrpB
MAAPLNPKDLAPLLKMKEVIKWDRKKGGLLAHTEIRIGAIVLGTRPLQKIIQADAKSAILEAIVEDGDLLLDFNEQVIQLLHRIQSLRRWNPNQNWPDWSVANLCETAENWLEPYLQNIQKNEDLKKLNLIQILENSLEFEQQNLLKKLAPSTLEVPSGSQIPLEYKLDGEIPLLSVRLQELFGLLETPKVNENKIPVLIELLSPGYKPVQLTQDLKSFWQNGYFEVRKELKRRYPKHEWPDDPIGAEAVRGVKRKT